MSAGRKRSGVWKVASLSRRLAALSAAHKAFSVDDPIVSVKAKMAMRAARRMRTSDGRPDARTLVDQKAALVKSDVLAMLATATRNPVVDARDRALIAVAFWSGGRRRSELVQAKIEDLTRVEDGNHWCLPTTKTTGTDEDVVVPIFGQAGVTLDAWLAMIGADSGSLFRSVTQQGDVTDHPIRGEDVRWIIRRRARLAGIDTAKISAHSIRSGFVTEAARQGVAMLDTMALTTHRSVETLRRYYRPAELAANPAARL